MAIVTRYFSTTGAGAADGTSWANRAALYSAGNWSTVITGFNFGGADSLNCLIGTGSYTCSQSLESGTFSVAAPTADNRLFLRSADGSGNPIVPDPSFISDARAITTTAMPFINYTAAGRCVNATGIVLYGLRIESAQNDGVVAQVLSVEQCYIVSTGVGSSASACFRIYNIKNSHLYCNTANYAAVVNCDENNTLSVMNSRIQGITGTTSNRRGISSNAFAPSVYLVNNTIIGMGGIGISMTGASAGDMIASNVINGTGSDGINISRSATGTSVAAQVCNNIITNCGGTGINQSSSVGMLASNNRLRNNGADFAGMGNYPSDMANETAAGTDADEFVNAAGGDYRIKSTSSMWGRRFGVSDHVAAGGGALIGKNALIG
jgi:hypothetical protein